MEDQVMEVLAEICGLSPDDSVSGADLFKEGFLDSFAALRLVIGLSEKFGLDLDIGDVSRDDLSSAASIGKFIRERTGAA